MMAYAQGFTALARLDAEASTIRKSGDGLQVDLALSQGVPYRAYTLADPARLVLDFQEAPSSFSLSSVDVSSALMQAPPFL